MKFVIPSKGRPDRVPQLSLKLFPDAYVCVAENEAAAYKAAGCQKLLVHPSDLLGIGPKRQWILDNVDDEIVIQIDDDLRFLMSRVGFHTRKITDPAEVQGVVERLAIMAKDFGNCLFGFAQGRHPALYSGCKPIVLHTWVGTVVGQVGRDLAYDTKLLSRGEDVDICLQALLKHRIIFTDFRYIWDALPFTGTGGNATNRNAERNEKEAQYLLKKWRGYLERQDSEKHDRLVLKVPR